MPHCDQSQKQSSVVVGIKTADCKMCLGVLGESYFFFKTPG